MKILINLNDMVRFSITEKGIKVWKDHCQKWNDQHTYLTKIIGLKDGDFVEMQLHTFMNIFGEFVTNGSPVVSHYNQLIYES